MKIYYVTNYRMPTERAHGIQIAKMCEAFIEAGAQLTLVVPRRKTHARSVREFYGLRVEVPKVTLFSFDWYTKGRVLYRLSAFSFMVSSYFYMLRRQHEKGAFVYTIDGDDWSYGQMPLFSIRYFAEMHGSKPRTIINRLFFRNIAGVITINRLIKENLQKLFSLSPDRVIVEHDAVDASHFLPIPRDESRKRLGLSSDAKLILYIGRILEWKGLEILPEAAKELASDGVTLGIVGGTREQFEQVTGKSDIPENLIFYGQRAFADMPLWIAAADAVLMTSTARNDLSYRWTSPMKAFEYMACGVPIIAADAPSMREIVSTDNAFLYKTDDAQSLTNEIRTVLENPNEAQHRAAAALRASTAYSWSGRAERILKFMASKTI